MHFQNINTSCPKVNTHNKTFNGKMCVCYFSLSAVTLRFKKIKRYKRENACACAFKDPFERRNHAPHYNSRQCFNEITVSHYSIAALIAEQRQTLSCTHIRNRVSIQTFSNVRHERTNLYFRNVFFLHLLPKKNQTFQRKYK